MKVLVINPNSSEEMTKNIRETVNNFVQNRFVADVVSVKSSPEFIGSYVDIAMAAQGILDCIKENENKYDAFILACHLDPNLDAAKEITNKLVVGIGEVSMKMASLLGRNFSVIGSSNKTTPLKQELVVKYGLKKYCSSIRTPSEEQINLSLEEKLILAAKEAVEKDKVDILVLGCAGFTGIDKKIEKEVGVKVLDGVLCSLGFVEGILR